MKKTTFDPLAQPVKKPVTTTSSQNTSNTESNKQSNNNTNNQSDSKNTTSMQSSLVKPIILTANQEQNKLKFLNISLIVQQNFEVNEELETNWITLKKNMMDLFCNNFSLEVKSTYSVNINDDEGKIDVNKG